MTRKRDVKAGEVSGDQYKGKLYRCPRDGTVFAAPEFDLLTIGAEEG